MFDTGSIFDLVLKEGIFSQFILIILVLMSFSSWAIIFLKWNKLKLEKKSSLEFLEKIRNKKNFLTYLANQKLPDNYLAFELKQAYKEYSKYKDRKDKTPTIKDDSKEMITSVERAIEKSISFQSSKLESFLSFLANISSSAPFIGLLGTVVGIIDSFHNIGLRGVTSLSVVAPGISIALVATALGIFVAIPALIGYNFFRSSIRQMTNEMREFGLEILNKFSWEY